MQITKEELQAVRKLRSEMHTLRGVINNATLLHFERQQAAKQLSINAAECRTIYNKVMTIPDPHIRGIIRARYIEGMAWRDIAQKIGNGCNADSIRIQVTRFLNKNS